jgi:acetyl esterase/lipase
MNSKYHTGMKGLFTKATAVAFICWRIVGISGAAQAVPGGEAQQRANAEPQVISLWPGAAPGSESWTQKETESAIPGTTVRIVQNVTRPTVTAFLPDPSKANGTAVVICPGGAFHFLTMDDEGTGVARWLNARGVAAFVLKYRLTRTGDDVFAQIQEIIRDRSKYDAIVRQLNPMIAADGQQAIRVVRQNSAKWGIDPGRIGILGFSAGGYLALTVALEHSADSRPDFLGAIYAPTRDDLPVPADAPPLFAVAADDDPVVSPAGNSVRIYSAWKAAGKPGELHIYSRGGHGFGIRKQNLPTDGWIDRFGEWLQVQGLLMPVRAK